MNRIVQPCSLALVLVIAACSNEDRGEAPTVEVRDSAGIRIVESHVPGGVAPVYAELGEPDLEIGAIEGDPRYLLTSVVAARTLEGGDILVAEGRSRELRIFDEAGAHLRSFGGEGDGPGEFASLTGVVSIHRDTIRAWDSRNQRITSYLVDGTPLGDFALPTEQVASQREVFALPDGGWLVGSIDLPVGRPPAGAFQTSYVLRHIGLDGGVDTLAVTPGRRMRPGEPRMTTTPDGRTVNAIILLAPLVDNESHTAVDRGFAFVGYNARYQIERRSLSGSLDMLIRVADLDRPLGPQEMEATVRFRLESCSQSEAECAQIVQDARDAFDPPELRPAYSDFLVDATGGLWVAEWARPGASVTGWHVFSGEGDLLGRVAIPPGLRIQEIGDDYVLGYVVDELEVPFVRRYPLARMR